VDATELIDAARKVCIPQTYAEVARRCRVSRQYVHDCRTGKKSPSNSFVLNLAELAGADPAEALLEHARDQAEGQKEREIWQGIVKRLGTLLPVAALLWPLTGSTPAPCAEQPSTVHSIHYAHWRRLGWAGLGRMLASLSALAECLGRLTTWKRGTTSAKPCNC
jgi:transcriptional regulator with XRE-family HTH domain